MNRLSRDATEQSLAADGAIACFSSSLVPSALNADRAPQLKRSVGLLRVMHEPELIRLIKTTLVLLLGAMVISCAQRQTSVVIKQGNPQQFIVSGRGFLDVFSISGPVRRCEAGWEKEQLTPMERYWEIAPLADFDVSELKQPIIYGSVPNGFRQVTPSNGDPPPICSGGPYSVQLAIRNGGGVNMLFAVYEGGRIVTESDGD